MPKDPSTDYCSIRLLTGRTYSPVEEFVPNQNVGTIFDAFRSQTFPSEPLPWGNPHFRKSGKPTHMIIWLSGDWQGWFMNEECKRVFERFNLGEHRFYPFHIKKDDAILPYHLFVVKPLSDRSVDVAKSRFHVEVDGPGASPATTEFPISSNDEYEARFRNGGLDRVKTDRLVLVPSFDPNLDCFAFDTVWPYPFISTRLRQALEVMHPTGFEFVSERILGLDRE